MKKTNNKGFSLVELIIVIAIMAVLIAVLAPQFLRYVERSRLQSDNTAIGEIANAVKIAASNEAISNEIRAAGATGVSIVIPLATAGTVTGGGTLLQPELTAALGNNVLLQSNTYRGAATAPTVQAIVQADGSILVQCPSYCIEVANPPVFANHIF